MQYDTALKLLLQQSGASLLATLAGAPVVRWLPIELPKVQNARLDLLGETAGGELLHIELQSVNASDMPLRMAEYYFAIYRQHGRFPRQVLLYLGSRKLSMPAELKTDALRFQYQLVDLRSLDGEPLLSSPEISDNVMAVLTRLKDERAALKEIVSKLEKVSGSRRESLFQVLLILCGLRGLEDLVEKEVRKMPILNDILEHKVLGREYKRGLKEGLQEGREEGLHEGWLIMLRRHLHRQFGPLPDWADAALTKLSLPELEQLDERLSAGSAQSLEELLQDKAK